MILRTTIYTAVLVLLSASATACNDPASVRSVSRDSSGVTITESSSPMWNAGEAWSVDAMPIVDLSRSSNEFYRVSNALVRPDGSIAVASRGSSTVTGYSAAGTVLFTQGAPGDGPGEYHRLTSVSPYRGDSLVAFDYWQRRLTFLDKNGRRGRIVTVDDLPGGAARTLHPLGRDRFILRVDALDRIGDAAGRTRIPQPLLVLEANGSLGDTVGVAAGSETFFFADGDARPPFARESFVDIRGETVVVGDADVLGYREYSVDGTLLRIVAVPGFPLEVSRSERDSVDHELASRPSRPRFGYLFDQMAASLPATKPAYSQLVVDSLGHVWLGEYRSGESPVDRSWYVFAPDGTWLGTVELPGRFQPYQIGADYLLGLSQDELDVETILVLRLNR